MIKVFNEEGVKTELIHVGNKAIRGCIACGYCMKNGKCVFNDDLVNEVAPKFETADGLVVGSPVYYGSPAAILHAMEKHLLQLENVYVEFFNMIELIMEPCRGCCVCYKTGGCYLKDDEGLFHF